MGLKTTIEKLDKYTKRLEAGKAKKIKPKHVDKAIRKLEAKQKLLQDEVAEAQTTADKSRLEGKLVLVREQLERATWLKEKISAL